VERFGSVGLCVFSISICRTHGEINSLSYIKYSQNLHYNWSSCAYLLLFYQFLWLLPAQLQPRFQFISVWFYSTRHLVTFVFVCLTNILLLLLLLLHSMEATELYWTKISCHISSLLLLCACAAVGYIVAVDSVSPTVFCISETGDLIRWFDCSDYMREPSDIAVSGKEYFVCDFKVWMLCF